MNPKDVPAIVAALRQKHPEVIDHLRGLTVSNPAVAEPIMAFLLDTFDQREQLLWQLRDLVSKRDVVGTGKTIWYLKHEAASMVRRIVAAADLDPLGLCYPKEDKPHE
jgi:hypothetical protein